MKKGKNINAILESNKSFKTVYDIYDPTFISLAYAFDLYNAIKLMCPNCINLIHRGVNSCKIYAKMKGADMNVVERLCDMIPSPDLTVFIEVSPDTAIERIKSRTTIENSWKEQYANLCLANHYFNECYEKEHLKSNYMKISGDDSSEENTEYILKAIRKVKRMKDAES